MPSSASASSAATWADVERQRQRRTRPRLAIAEQSKHLGMVSFDGRRQHSDHIRPGRFQYEASLRRVQSAQRPECFAQPPDLDTQPRAMRLIGITRPKGARDQRFARDIFGPRLGEHAGEREQHRTTSKRNDAPPGAHDLAAGIDHERVRSNQRLDLG